MTAEQVLALVRDNAVEFVDLRFVPVTGRVGHVTVPIEELSPQTFQRGVAGGGMLPNERLLVPAADTAFIDPFCQHPTLAVLCDVRLAATGDDAQDDPRAVARRAQEHLRATGIADEALIGVKIEFFVFDQVCYEQQVNAARYQVDSREGTWRSGRDEPNNLGTQLRSGESSHALPPADSLHNLRAEMAAALAACGVPVRGHRHGAATGGQAALRLAPAPLVRAADQIVTCKYVVRNVAARHGKVATFMPQPLCDEPGSGLPVRLSLWKGSQPVLCGAANPELTDLGRYAAGGWLRHAASLLALTCPTTNSYCRLAASFDAPTHVGYSGGRQAALVGTPVSCEDPQSSGLEFRASDPSSNPYLSLAALVLAALDGITQRIDPGPPLDERPEEAPAERLPRTLEDALEGLAADHAYLRQGDAFPADLIRCWLDTKRHNEIDALRSRPHPYEFCLYFDI